MKKAAKKNIVIGLAALAVVLVLGANYLWSNLDHIVKVAIQKYGTAATQTEVHLDSVRLSLASGEGSLGGLSVGSPSGFAAEKALHLSEISVKLDTGSIAGTGPIVIRELAIDKPQVNYEINNSGDSNLQTIARNAKAYAKTVAGGKNADAGSGGPGRKLIINDLVIRKGVVSISQATLNKQLAAELPAIHLTNIGRNSGGATAAQVAEQLLGSITNAAAKAASGKLIAEQLKGTIGAPAADTVGKVGSEVEGLFGNAE